MYQMTVDKDFTQDNNTYLLFGTLNELMKVATPFIEQGYYIEISLVAE